ncbi:hypothetical protein WPS_18200 [Vulcanimicrobium alpinum]|uniref:Uncharacterized protein n=1 Tax=Vulcanimicrobium alpinum TaxID=3016050 RepID=A0AAN1XW99_UNVUL|nr:hypothetical protein [Vulcanimicrobium alpinum]BDE06544.1 hypothetical protein WPS_18200 [Vulcanimicrobium alpinum]
MSGYVPPASTTFTGDPNHNFYIQQYQIDGAPITAAQPGAGGKMDRYLALANVPGDGTQGGLPMGQYDVTNLPEGKIAQQFVLADNSR